MFVCEMLTRSVLTVLIIVECSVVLMFLDNDESLVDRLRRIYVEV